MIKLPDERFRYNESDYDDGFANGFNAAIVEVQRLNATAQPVSDGCKVPEGWKLVLIEPTEEMISAWRKDMDRSYAGYFADGIGEDEIVFGYQAMLAAAPGGQDA